MNKTLTVNIAGSVFHIDENAFVKLDHYLKTIKKSFSIEEQDEIIHDIEIRVSELFLEKLTPSKQNINLQDVDQVISILGAPEDYIIEQDSTSESFTYYPKSKKLFRDTQNGILGGVLAGLGHYFKIDPVWLRIIFAVLVLFFGTGVLLYLILWIVIPAAKTTSQILQMQGEPITVETIQKKVKQNIDVIQDKFQQVDYNKYKNKAQVAGRESGKLISRILGIIFLVISSIVILFNVVSFFILWINKGVITNFFAPVDISFLNDFPLYYNKIFFNALLLVTLPFVGLFIIGLRMVYTNLKYILLSLVILFVIWVASIFYFTAIVLDLEKLSDKHWDFIINQRHIIQVNHNSSYSKPLFTYPKNNTVNKSLSTSEAVELTVVLPEYFEQKNTTLGNPDKKFIFESQPQNMQFQISPTFSNEIYVQAKLINKKDNSVNTNVDTDLLDLMVLDNQIIIPGDFSEKLTKEFDDKTHQLTYTIYLPQAKSILMTKPLQELLNDTNLQIGKKYSINSQRELICLDCN
ncbi:PspC domain-containing protein [Myroides sp. LJL110]